MFTKTIMDYFCVGYLPLYSFTISTKSVYARAWNTSYNYEKNTSVVYYSVWIWNSLVEIPHLHLSVDLGLQLRIVFSFCEILQLQGESSKLSEWIICWGFDLPHPHDPSPQHVFNENHFDLGISPVHSENSLMCTLQSPVSMSGVLSFLDRGSLHTFV